MARDRRRSERRGRIAETAAAWWLRLKGWQILDRRVRTPLGEVDLIVRKPGMVVFVEVKARASGEELDLIDARHLRRVAAAAELLAPRYAEPDDGIRIDVVLIAPGRRLRHVENAWIGG